MITKQNYLKKLNQTPISREEYNRALEALQRNERPMGRLEYAELQNSQNVNILKLYVPLFLSNGTPRRLQVVPEDDRIAQLQSIYDEPTTFSTSRETFYNHIKQNYVGISKRFAYAWLQKQEAYQLHVPVRQPKDITPIVSRGPLVKLQADLVIFQTGHLKHYLLNVIDVFSKFAASRYMTTKTAERTAQRMAEIIDNMEALTPTATVRAVQSDNGSEFLGQFSELLQQRGIRQIFSTAGKPQTNGMIERFNKTLKRIIFAYMTKTGNTLIDVIRTNNGQILQDLVSNYNRLINKQTGYSPINMLLLPDSKPAEEAINMGSSESKRHERTLTEIARKRQKDRVTKQTTFDRPPNLKSGDRVRIALQAYDPLKYDPKKYKSYLPQWTDVTYIVRTSGPKRTTLTFENGELAGSVQTMHCQKI